MALISIIVPAYNAVHYLPTCLSSLPKIFHNSLGYELIIINDGSTDGTKEWVDFYQSTHPQTIVIHQENKGLGAARNAGLRVATSPYICFLDADDRITSGSHSKIWGILSSRRGPEMVGIKMIQRRPNGRRVQFTSGAAPNYGHSYIPARKFLKGRNIMPCSVAYIYNREFLINNQIFFREDIRHEDLDFVLRCFLKANGYVALLDNFYEYVIRPESITTTTDQQKQQQSILDMLTILREHSSQPDPELRACLQFKLDYLAVDILRLLFRKSHNKEFRKNIIGQLRSLGYYPLHWHWEWKYILFNLLMKIRLQNV